MKKVLIADKLSEEGIRLLQNKEDIAADVRTGLSPEELEQAIGEYDAIIVRSKTQVTKAVIEQATRLKVIARAGVGVDNVDVEAATKKGIMVMNTPQGNTMSTCELTMAMLLALSRDVCRTVAKLKGGSWDKKAYEGAELVGKTLGVVGLGRIGGEVAKRALSFGLRVVCYDPFASEDVARRLEVKLVSFDDLLRESDYITFHTPLTEETRHMVSYPEFQAMKPGVRIINCARGGLINEKALYQAVKEGKVAGCALDVFEEEPPKDRALIELDQVICTPHVGAQTEEAQRNVAVQVAEQVIDALDGKMVRNTLNIPQIDPEIFEQLGPYILLAEKLGRFLVHFVDGRIERVRVIYRGEMNDHNVSPITTGLQKGLLEPILQETVNYVSAPLIAKERGLNVTEVRSGELEDFANLITVHAQTVAGDTSVSGTLFSRKQPRIVRIDEFHVDIVPDGHLLVCRNQDKPGVIAHVSTILAERAVNIANMTVGRDEPGGTAVTVLNVDTVLDDEVVDQIEASPIILDAKQVAL